MTLQQLEYIVAVEKYRHFAKAAESCHVTQSTLSMMIQKLEQELEINIFDRKTQPVEPTPIGVTLLAQAKVILYNAKQFKELALSEKEQESGKVTFGIIPTVAPYILPKLFNILQERNPNINLHVKEITTAEIINQLEKAEIDMALLATPLNNPNLLEIPIYYERFFAYVSPTEPLYNIINEYEMRHLPTDHLWILKEGHCLRNQVMRLCESESGFSTTYEAGSIDTLVKIVDTNGGYTIIPELHLDFLSEKQKANVRPIVNPEPNREISLVVRNDYVKEKLLNVIARNISDTIPENMLDERLKKFSIKL
ncbi:MAG: LysR family transcriptional regulator [Bacteroidales bacterium]|nr:LysR family transcriptional regulator [Bacteroidales bacterium]